MPDLGHPQQHRTEGGDEWVLVWLPARIYFNNRDIRRSARTFPPV